MTGLSIPVNTLLCQDLFLVPLKTQQGNTRSVTVQVQWSKDSHNANTVADAP